MRLGYAQDIITPDLTRPVFLAGFGQNRKAESIHDDLYVRSLAVSDGNTILVICALDLIGFFQNDVADVIRGVQESEPAANVIIAATHTHHGPDTIGLWGPDDKTTGVDSSYLSWLKGNILKTILKSLEMPYIVNGVKSGSVQVPGVVKNARNPEIIDDELTILQFLTLDDNPLLTFVNFPCHPEVLFDQNTQITSDYPGVLRREVEQATGAPCIFTSGALGGMMTPNVEDHSFEEAELMGKHLAKKCLETLSSLDIKLPASISVRKSTFKVRLTNILFKIAVRRGLVSETRDRRGFITTETNLLKIGDCWLVTAPGELLPVLGLEIKTWLKDAGAGVSGVIGLGNDELGYILPKRDYRYPLNPLNPGSHYEETMSISKQIGPRFMEAVSQLLTQEIQNS